MVKNKRHKLLKTTISINAILHLADGNHYIVCLAGFGIFAFTLDIIWLDGMGREIEEA